MAETTLAKLPGARIASCDSSGSNPAMSRRGKIPPTVIPKSVNSSSAA